MGWTVRHEEAVQNGGRGRRAFVRRPVVVSGDYGSISGTIFTLFADGCAIESGMPVRVSIGSVLALRLHVSDRQQPIEVEEAEVTWVAGTDFGVQFRCVKPSERGRLNGHLSELLHGTVWS